MHNRPPDPEVLAPVGVCVQSCFCLDSLLSSCKIPEASRVSHGSETDGTNLTVIWPFHLSVGNENLKSFHNYRHGLNSLSFFRTPKLFSNTQKAILNAAAVQVTCVYDPARV